MYFISAHFFLQFILYIIVVKKKLLLILMKLLVIVQKVLKYVLCTSAVTEGEFVLLEMHLRQVMET